MADTVGLKNNIDADDDFRYSTGKGRPSKLYRNASLLLIPLAVYQVVYTYVGNDPYLVRNIMNSTVSLLVSLLVIAWSWVSFSHSDDISALRKHYAEGVLNSNNIFVVLAVAIVQHSVCLFELSVTRSWVADNFTATLKGDALSSAIKNEARYEQWNLIAQVLTTLFFIVAARLSYKTLYNEEETIGTTLVAGSFVVSAASFALLYFDLHANYYEDLSDISNHYQPWLLTWIFALAIVFVVLAVAAWLVHHRQWRGILPFVWVSLLIVLFLGIPLAGRSYQNTAEVHATWSGQTGNWVNRLTNVSESYLASEGCPVKYIGRNDCGYDTSVYPWENTTDPHSQYLECINPSCLGVLGQIYANDFLLVSRTFSVAVAGCFLLLLCLSFQWHHGVSLELQGSKKNYIGVGLIAAVLVAFLAVHFSYVAPYPETYPGSPDKLRYSNAIAAHPALRMVTHLQGIDNEDLPFDITDELQERLFNFILFQSEKYLIFQLYEDLSNMTLTDSGDFGLHNYDDFYNSVSNLKHALALVWVEVAEQRVLIVTLYVSPSASSNLQLVYSEVNKMRDEIEDDDGVAAIITQDIEDLILENAMQDHLRMFNTRGEPSFFGYVEVPRVKLPYPNTDAWDNKDLSLPEEEWDFEIELTVNEMRNFRTPNFVSCVWEDGRWIVGKTGAFVSFYELREAMLEEGYDMSETVVFFYDFVYEQRHQPIASIIGIENLGSDQAASLLGFIRALDTVAIPFYPLIEPAYYDLDYLVNFGAIPDPNARIAINDDFLAEVQNYLDQM